MNVAPEVLLNVQYMQYTCKCHHVTCHDLHGWWSELQLYWCLKSALHGDEMSFPCSGRFNPEVRALLGTVEKAGSHPGLVWTEKGILLPTASDHRTVQPVAGSYTVCTTLTPLNILRKNITVMCTVSCTVGHGPSIVIVVVANWR